VPSLFLIPLPCHPPSLSLSLCVCVSLSLCVCVSLSVCVSLCLSLLCTPNPTWITHAYLVCPPPKCHLLTLSSTVCSLTNLLVYLLIPSLAHLPTCSLTLVTHSTCSLTHSLTCSMTQSLIHLNHSPTHSLTNSLSSDYVLVTEMAILNQGRI